MQNNTFLQLLAIIVFAAMLAALSLPFIIRMFDLQSRRAIAVLFAIAFVVFGGVGFVAVQALINAGGSASAFHRKQAKQLEETTLLR